ncbi:MAG TPA: hypothetical protein VLF71_01355 [Candidatus Saccharimonadales bacterium]|nr:hypothetical protein [Candidatus Saccharimonadales bacterium]
MLNSAEITPLAGLAGVESRLDWRLSLPAHVGGNLGVNLPAIDRLSSWATLGTVSIVDGTVPEQDVPAVGDVSGTGAATAAASLSFFRRPTRHQWGTASTTVRPDNPYIADATIKIDAERTARRISEAGLLHDVEAWRAELNRAVMLGLGHAAASHLLRRQKIFDLSGMAMGVAITAAIEPGTLDSPQATAAKAAVTVAELVILGVGIPVAFRLSDRNIAVFMAGMPSKEVPWSLLPFGIDRLAMFKVGAAVHRNPIRALR